MSKWNRWSAMIIIGALIQAIGEIGKVVTKTKEVDEETE